MAKFLSLWKKQITFCLIVLFGLLLQSKTGFTAINNGSFENGINGWNIVQGNVEVLESTNFSPTISPPDGTHFLLISNGPGDNSTAPDDSPYSDMDNDGQSDNQLTIVSQTFTTSGGLLCFSWSWLTSEEDEPSIYDDIFYVLLDHNIILSGSVDKTPEQSSFPNVPTDDISYSVNSSGPTNGSIFDDGRSPFQDFCIQVSSGTHTIEFAVADQGDSDVDSGLIIDNVRIKSNVAVPTMNQWGIFFMVILFAIAGFYGLMKKSSEC